jgi:Asp-tRNA(Asn)/Glu-tRNA(Gln) amidotransferase A subunit family amidase
MTLERREFLKILGMFGATTALSSACSTIPTPLPTETPTAAPSEGEITVEMIAAAEKIFGIELTDEERKEVVEGLYENLEHYQALRERQIDDTVVPSMVFNPIPPGMTFSREQKPVRYSDVAVEPPSQIEDIAFSSVLELAKLIQTRQITSAELTEMYLSRLKRYDPRLQFVVNLTEDLAHEQAHRADEEIQVGNYRGPLHGIPYGIKDLFSVKGYPTTWGAEPFRDRIIDRNASVVEKLEEAGAVLIAKLTTGTLASGEHWFGGETKNPWKPSEGSGGSSAGPAAATAAGCVGFSIGTETNGSMISPCDACGVTGLRPTFGRVSRYGAMTTSWSFDKVTPICRTVEDCAVVFDAIYGPDGRDNTIIDLPFNWEFDLDIRELKIGYRTLYFEGELMSGDASFRRSVRRESVKVLDFFRELGIDPAPLDFDLDTTTAKTGIGLTMMCENAAAADEMFRSGQGDLFQDQKWPNYWRRYRFVPAVEYLQATRSRSLAIEEMNRALSDVDVYIEITWTGCWLTNVTGHPIVVAPCGFVDGRPISITFVGRLFGEAETLAVAKAFQDGTDFHRMHPQL